MIEQGGEGLWAPHLRLDFRPVVDGGCFQAKVRVIDRERRPAPRDERSASPNSGEADLSLGISYSHLITLQP